MMTTVCLYKLLEGNVKELRNKLRKEGYAKKKKEIDDQDLGVRSELWETGDGGDHDLPWGWALKIFDEVPPKIGNPPKAVIIFSVNSNNGDEFYVCSFGGAYRTVDVYADVDWPLRVASRLKLSDLKTSSLVSPHSQKNRVINSYVRTDYLDYSSGEAYTFLRARVESKLLSKGPVSFGNSIRFSIDDNPSELTEIINIIKFFKDLMPKEEVTRIPLFVRVNPSGDKISDYEDSYYEACCKGEADSFVVDDFSIKGSRVSLGENSGFILVKGGSKRRKFEESEWKSEILLSNIADFIKNENEKLKKENKELKKDDVLSLLLVIKDDEGTIYKKKLIESVYYSLSKKGVVLLSGKWYKCNAHFRDDLLSSMHDVQVEEGVNFSKAVYDSALDALVAEGRYAGKDNPKESARKEWYRERWFNNELSNGESEYLSDYGYQLFDRKLTNVEDIGRIETADLYKDDTLYAVKFGSSASELCYAFDQSYEGARQWKMKHVPEGIESVSSVCVWLVLTRKQELPKDKNGLPDLAEMSSFLIKMRLDEWVKNIRLLGFRPVVRISYVRD